MNRSIVAARCALLVVALSLTSGCFLLGAGAGAVGSIYFTDRGTSSLAEGSLEALAERTRAVFEEMQIEPTGEETAPDGGDMEIAGKNGPLDITVDLERKGPSSTLVQVSARRDGVAWNKDYAKMVLERILAEP